MGTTELTDEQKTQIALDMLEGRMSHARICRKWGISRDCACRIRDHAIDLLLKEMKRSSRDIDNLRTGVKDLRKLVRDHSFVVGYLKKKMK